MRSLRPATLAGSLAAVLVVLGGATAPGCGNSDDPSDCTYYQDEVGPATSSLVLVNKRSTPVFFAARTCSAEPAFALTDAAGEAVDILGPACGEACTDVAEGTLCQAQPCETHALIELAPGGSFTLTWDGGAWQDEAIPGICAYQAKDDATPCRLERAVEGSFTLAFTAFTEATCGAAPCSCTPAGGAGTCAIDGPATTGASIEIKTSFTFPLSNPKIPIEIPIQ